MNEEMNKQAEQFTKHAENLTNGVRSYSALAIDYLEKLTNTQFAAVKSLSEVGLQQTRAALEIRDQADLQAYVKSQQEVAKQVGEQIKGDVQKITSLNEEFASHAKKLVEGNVKTASKKAA